MEKQKGFRILPGRDPGIPPGARVCTGNAHMPRARTSGHDPTHSWRRCPWEAQGLDSVTVHRTLPVTLWRPQHKVSPELMLPKGNHSEPHVFHMPTAARERAPHSPRTSDTPNSPASQHLIPEPKTSQPEPQTLRILRASRGKRFQALNRLSHHSQGLGEAASCMALNTKVPGGPAWGPRDPVSNKDQQPAQLTPVGTDVLRMLGDRVWAERLKTQVCVSTT